MDPVPPPRLSELGEPVSIWPPTPPLTSSVAVDTSVAAELIEMNPMPGQRSHRSVLDSRGLAAEAIPTPAIRRRWPSRRENPGLRAISRGGHHLLKSAYPGWGNLPSVYARLRRLRLRPRPSNKSRLSAAGAEGPCSLIEQENERSIGSSACSSLLIEPP